MSSGLDVFFRSFSHLISTRARARSSYHAIAFLSSYRATSSWGQSTQGLESPQYVTLH